MMKEKQKKAKDELENKLKMFDDRNNVHINELVSEI